MAEGRLLQQEIFGRFVLLEQLDAHGAETCRAVDLSRELSPMVTVRRLPRWGRFTQREHRNFTDAAALRQRMHGELVASHVDHGEIEGVPYWASQYVPGVSLDRFIERAVDREYTDKALPLTVCYCVAAALIDLTGDRADRGPNASVAPLVHPRRVILGWSGRPVFLGTSYEQATPDDEERRFTPPKALGRLKPYADAYGVAGLIVESCTGMPFDANVEVTTARGPLGAVPAELHRAVAKAMRMEHHDARELLNLLEPLMKAAGGGHFSDCAAVMAELFADAHAADDAMLERDQARSRRLRKRLAKSDQVREAVTRKLHIRPASQEGPAFLEEQVDLEVPAGMITVQGGRFLFGTALDAPRYVDVKPFLIDKHPVTHRELKAFLDATATSPPWGGVYPEALADCPVVNVSHELATAYAAWAKKRLPSEVEWELAARGFDGRAWPWGHEFDRDRMPQTWMKPWGTRGTVPVGSYSPTGDSPFGVADVGQAWEWTADAGRGGTWVVRGGPWRNRVEPPQIGNRSHEDRPSADVTFRCVRSVVGDGPARVPGTLNPALDEETNDDM
ncbi:MAG: SUMF1/EgtB/PvdO family nonheme iron enzyme [Deltaproteobacteria bacterium]|nr:SUMF1/EgtB/PvdO family nonheme iron enzyme [Deltaproteobacteria bacterium]